MAEAGEAAQGAHGDREPDLDPLLTNTTKLELLQFLRERPMTATETARRLDVHRSTTSRHLRSLEDDGYVERQDSDRKWVYYDLTTKGRAVAVLGSRLVLGLSLAVGAGSIVALVLAWYRRLPDATGAPDADGAPAMPAPPAFPVAEVLLVVVATAIVVALHWYLSPRRRAGSG